MDVTFSFWGFLGVCIGFMLMGLASGLGATRELRKSYEKEYTKKHNEIYNTIRRETKNEWGKGWDAAYKHTAETGKAYYVWFIEHGYEPDQIEEWYKDWLRKPDGLKHYDDGSVDT